VDVVVKEGTSRKSLADGAVHYPGSALPGEEGNCVVSGHRTTYGSPFHWLDRLEPGDGIVVQTAKGWAFYIVEEVKVIPGSELWKAIFGAADTRLTLLTCNPLFSARQRLIVVAKPGRPSQERLWAGPPLHKRTRQGTPKEFDSQALQWLRELAKESARPPELAYPTCHSEQTGSRQGSERSVSPAEGSPAPRMLAPTSGGNWDHRLQARHGASEASGQVLAPSMTTGSTGNKAETGQQLRVPAPVPVAPRAAGNF